MTDQVADLLKGANAALRRYKALNREHLNLIDRRARIDRESPEHADLERQAAKVVSEIAALAGPL